MYLPLKKYSYYLEGVVAFNSTTNSNAPSLEVDDFCHQKPVAVSQQRRASGFRRSSRWNQAITSSAQEIDEA